MNVACNCLFIAKLYCDKLPRKFLLQSILNLLMAGFKPAINYIQKLPEKTYKIYLTVLAVMCYYIQAVSEGLCKTREFSAAASTLKVE